MAPQQLPVLNAQDYRVFASEQLVTAGATPLEISDQSYLSHDKSLPEYYTYHNNTNWQDVVFRNGLMQNYHGHITGGDDVAKYAISLGYMDVQSTLNTASINRFNTRVNTDINLSPKMTLSVDVAYSQTSKDVRDDGIVSRSSPSFLALIKSPLLSPYLINEQGTVLKTYADDDILGVSNPAVLQADPSKGLDDQHRLDLNGKLTYALGKYWQLNGVFGYKFDKSTELWYIPDYGVSPEIIPNTTQTSIRQSKSGVSRYIGMYGDASAQFDKVFNYVHHFKADFGARQQTNTFAATEEEAHNSGQDSNPYLASSMIGRVINYNEDVWNWFSAYANLDYSLKERYHLSVNLSEDGSSRAGKNNQFGFFPSAKLAWDIAGESFMKNISFVNKLQLYVSGGLSGNDNISNLSASNYFLGTDFLTIKGLVLMNLRNDDLKWETTQKTQAGINLALFNNRLTLAADVYLHKTKDLITIQQLDLSTGFSYMYANGGEMENKGAELNLGVRIIDSRDFKWLATVSVGTYKNKVTALPNNQDIVTDYLGAQILTKVGQPLGVFYGYKTEGVFATSAEASAAGLSTYYNDRYLYAFEAGDMHFYNADGNNIIDKKDRVVIGDPNPDFYGAIGMSFVYKNISLDATFTGVYGNDVYNSLRAQTEGMKGNVISTATRSEAGNVTYTTYSNTFNIFNQSTHVLNRWKAEGQVTDVPRADIFDRRGNARFSDRWIEDGSYLRLKNLTVTYKFPKQVAFLQGFSVFVAANNVFTLTKYLGGDPEFSTASGTLMQGVDAGYLSQGRSFIGGVKINL
jgi:TonB-linked SusC/RagA family outer membrane protein